jgi:hypothetical protein
MNEAKLMLKIATVVCDGIHTLSLECLLKNESEVSRACTRLERFANDNRLLGLAVQRRWSAAAGRIRDRIQRNLSDLSCDLQYLKGMLDQTIPAPPKLSEVVAELMQLEDEYGPFKYDPKERSLAVTTDPITLEDVFLGSFEIRLFPDRIGRMYKETPYRIIALDPHPAGTDSSVTHPHVSGKYLCEGDGYMLIRNALQQGRICDFFSLVIGILNTYNPDSPYVSLDDWEGFSCYDCGRSMARDDSSYCERCDNEYCDQCSSYCPICDSTICLGCLTECPQCQKPVCPECTAVCAACHKTVCADCIDETGMCEQCNQNQEDEYDEDESEQTNTTAA